jgi:hypothetical protein
MDDLSVYESRTGTLSCSTREIFDFVTDIRNFEQFIPGNTINNWQSDRDTCSFTISMVGIISVRITEKHPYSKVTFNGDALKKNDFSLVLNMNDNTNNTADVKIVLEAELNPVLKMMASKPIDRFLEILVSEMEKFTSWGNIIK